MNQLYGNQMGFLLWNLRLFEEMGGVHQVGSMICLLIIRKAFVWLWQVIRSFDCSVFVLQQQVFYWVNLTSRVLLPEQTFIFYSKFPLVCFPPFLPECQQFTYCVLVQLWAIVSPERLYPISIRKPINVCLMNKDILCPYWGLGFQLSATTKSSKNPTREQQISYF